MRGTGGGWTAPAAVLIDPAGVLSRAVAAPQPWKLLLVLLVAAAVLGLGTLPRQLEMLWAALPDAGNPLLDAQSAALRRGLLRLIFFDRLVPLPAALFAGLALVLTADPVLMLPASRRRELLTVAVLGLAPLLVQRVGELAMTWLVDPSRVAAAGEALTVPHRFASGARLFWREPGPAPYWVELLEVRVNLFTLWCAGLWSIGLRTLDGRRWEAWQVLLPLACLAAGSFLTWLLGPVVVPIILRGVGG
jgi:hypothetical protein